MQEERCPTVWELTSDRNNKRWQAKYGSCDWNRVLQQHTPRRPEEELVRTVDHSARAKSLTPTNRIGRCLVLDGLLAAGEKPVSKVCTGREASTQVGFTWVLILGRHSPRGVTLDPCNLEPDAASIRHQREVKPIGEH